MKYVVGIIALLGIIGGGWYLVSNTTSEEDVAVATEKLAITTSFYPLEFALSRIVGDLGTVTNIGAGRDPHNYEPSTQDMVVLQQSDLVVLQGADFEPWGDAVQERLTTEGVSVVLATADLDLHEGGHRHDEESTVEDHTHEEADHGHEDAASEDEHANNSSDEMLHRDDHTDDEHSHEDEHTDADHGHDHGAYDPHTWLNPVLFSQTVDTLVHKISTLDPENAATYEANAAILRAELSTLNSEYRERLTNCAVSEVITSHDAFGYLAEEYGFTVHSIAGLSTQDTPSAATLAALRAEAADGITAILLEENNITAYGETLARETGLQTLMINPISFVIPEGEDYLTLMRANLETFATALACNV